MRKTKDGRSPAAILLPSAAAGLLTTLFLMLIGAVLVHRGAVSDGMIAYLALAFLAVGCAAAAAVSAVRAPGAKFLWAMGAGTLVFLILPALGRRAARPAGTYRARGGQPGMRAGGLGARRSRRCQ